MLQKIYSIKDIKANVFSAPFCLANDDICKRTIVNIRNTDVNHIWNTAPADFEVWCLGSFDDELGHLTSCERYEVYDEKKVALLPSFIFSMFEINKEN